MPADEKRQKASNSYSAVVLSCLVLNLYFYGMDDHFHRKTQADGNRYGRLHDDFIASSNHRSQAIALGLELDNAITHRGLQVNARKREKKGLMDDSFRKEIHSLIINSKRGLRPKSEHIQKALQKAAHYARRCNCAKIADLPSIAVLRQEVTGLMYYLNQADRSPSKHIHRMVDSSDDKVLRMIKSHGLQPHKNKWWVISKNRNEAVRLTQLWQSNRVLNCAI